MAELSDDQLTQLQELLDSHKQQQVVTAPPVATTQATGFSLKLGGQDYTVRDQGEAQRLLDQYDAQRSQEVEAQRIRAEALEQAQGRQQVLETRQKTGDTFDKEEYARLFLDDPRKARKYELAHDPEQIQFYQGLVNQINTLKQEQAATQFLFKHKDDYVPSAESYKAIESVITQYNLPWDLNGMELAYTVAKEMGAIQQPQGGNRQQQVEDDQEADVQPSFVAAPRVNRRRSSQNQAADESAQILSQFESLSPDAQKKYLESLTV